VAHYRKAVDTRFFDKWSPAMAYVLGYFAADGNMFVNSHGSKYIGFCSTDRVLLYRVKTLLSAQHRVTLRRRSYGLPHWKRLYQLQIGGGELFVSLQALGFTPNKSKTMRFPDVPPACLASFVRGYLDGDGCVGLGWTRANDRRSLKRYIQLCFVSGSFEFLRRMDQALQTAVGIHSGYLRERHGEGCYLYYQRRPDLKRLHAFLYPENLPACLYLARKKRKFDEVVKILGA